MIPSLRCNALKLVLHLFAQFIVSAESDSSSNNRQGLFTARRLAAPWRKAVRFTLCKLFKLHHTQRIGHTRRYLGSWRFASVSQTRHFQTPSYAEIKRSTLKYGIYITIFGGNVGDITVISMIYLPGISGFGRQSGERTVVLPQPEEAKQRNSPLLMVKSL